MATCTVRIGNQHSHLIKPIIPASPNTPIFSLSSFGSQLHFCISLPSVTPPSTSLILVGPPRPVPTCTPYTALHLPSPAQILHWYQAQLLWSLIALSILKSASHYMSSMVTLNKQTNKNSMYLKTFKWAGHTPHNWGPTESPQSQFPHELNAV